MNYFDKNIALILCSKGVFILKQLKKALERCDRSENTFIVHENCASGQWIQPQKVPPGIDQGSVMGDTLKKMNETAYVWNLMFRMNLFLLNYGPSWWKHFKHVEPSCSKALRQVASTSICLCPIDLHCTRWELTACPRTLEQTERPQQMLT